jgi:hypothetical protein
MIKNHNQHTISGSANAFGYYTAIFMAVITAVTFAIAICTPPISGPYCPGDCLEYPFPGIESRFPRDYIWMYPAILLNMVFVVLAVCIHGYASAGRKTFSLAGLAFAVMSAGILATNYFIQVSVIQPSLLKGETDGILLLTQYNTHGLFIALEEIGLLLMSFSFLFMAFVFRKEGPGASVRWIFIIAFILAMVSLIVYSVVFGIHREYHYEVAIITINWLTLIVSSILIARVFKKTTG